MDDFEDFEITQDILTQIENIEINLLDKILGVNSNEPLLSRKRRLRILSTSEGSDAEIGRTIKDLESSSLSNGRSQFPTISYK
ncbi:unnamed protein product [Parnassius apollo]|uniref:(apollo) hypothetical protein n=1 Tax=Parnassius apollo TaxID=110799 RepID=A0A8S3XHZ6_PARAO|nr:unnamed protein product [Parnassius apollo]